MEMVIEVADFLKDVSHFIDGVVPAFRCRTMAGHAEHFDLDLHAAAVTAVDVAVGGLGGDDELGTDLVLVDDVLPAQAVTVFFLNGSGDQDFVFIGEHAQIFHDLCAVDG